MNRALEFSLVQKIRRRAKPLADVSAEELRKSGLSLKYRASVGEPLEKLIPEAFPLVIEAIRRSLNMTPYDVQIFAAMQIAKGRIAEMKTVEGKSFMRDCAASWGETHIAAGEAADLAKEMATATPAMLPPPTRPPIETSNA